MTAASMKMVTEGQDANANVIAKILPRVLVLEITEVDVTVHQVITATAIAATMIAHVETTTRIGGVQEILHLAQALTQLALGQTEPHQAQARHQRLQAANGLKHRQGLFHCQYQGLQQILKAAVHIVGLSKDIQKAM